MSGLLAGKVWQSDLDSHLKPLAAALADIANDDGTSIYPSVAYMAWLLSKGERSVQMGLSELKEKGIIEAMANEHGGRGLPTEYVLHEEKLPQRQAWRVARKGATVSGFRRKQKGAVLSTKGCNSEQERVQLSTERVKPVAPDPLVEPLGDPLEEPKREVQHKGKRLNTSPVRTSNGNGKDHLPDKVELTLPAWLPADVWAEWLTYRKESHHPVTPTSARKQIKKLGEFQAQGCDPLLVIEQSIANGWQGLFALNGHKPNDRPLPRQTETQEEKQTRIRKAWEAGGYGQSAT